MLMEVEIRILVGMRFDSKMLKDWEEFLSQPKRKQTLHFPI